MKRAGLESLACIILSLFFAHILFSPSGYCQEPSDLVKKGIEHYQLENFEEAIEILNTARKKEPESSLAAFFLGMAYKQVLDYQSAAGHFRDAVTLEPRIKDALPELISVLYKLNDFEEAKKWIEVAESESVKPAQIAFLKGLVYQKEGLNSEAIAAFEKARTLDPSLTQAAEFQIAVCCVKEKKLDEANQRFQAAIIADPQSDLASFARRYQDLVEERIFAERPFRVTLGLFGQYDSNVVLKPDETAFANGISNEDSMAAMPTIGIDFVPQLDGPGIFSAHYSFVSNFHENNSTTHDLTGNTITLSPGYNFGRSALNFNFSYNHFLLHGSRYMEIMTYGPLYRFLLNERNILEVFAGYSIKNYFQDIVPPDFENDRDGEGINAYASWVWLFRKDSFFNLKYEFIEENTDGIRYDNQGHRVSANVIIPLLTDLKLQLSAAYFRQEYRYRLRYPEIIGGLYVGVPKERRDNNYSGSIGIIWEANRNMNVIVQYSSTDNSSNDTTSEYTRHLYTAGIEFKF
ncbi:MAG: tetratricopeptide repeat protein [Syntrophales bacterium]|nr:tetratricopeptide repeat protein [Syntrophales bacterium]MDY0044267.1 tetratricopeptide repeat protein [Syntrophales bacterium]